MNCHHFSLKGIARTQMPDDVGKTVAALYRRRIDAICDFAKQVLAPFMHSADVRFYTNTLFGYR
jgi:hypothetical protein